MKGLALCRQATSLQRRCRQELESTTAQHHGLGIGILKVVRCSQSGAIVFGIGKGRESQRTQLTRCHHEGIGRIFRLEKIFKVTTPNVKTRFHVGKPLVRGWNVLGLILLVIVEELRKSLFDITTRFQGKLRSRTRYPEWMDALGKFGILLDDVGFVLFPVFVTHDNMVLASR